MCIHGSSIKESLCMEWFKKVGKVPEVREQHASSGLWWPSPLMGEKEGCGGRGKRPDLNQVDRHDDAKGSQIGL